MKQNRIELFNGRDGWRIRLRAKNGRIVLVSEAYDTKGNAIRAAKLVAKVTALPIVQK